jgi:phosphatidylserine synthase
MSEPIVEHKRKPIDFSLTLKQRRLRTVTAVIVVAVIVMIAVGMIHPFFHPSLAQNASEVARKAFKAQLLMIAFYWTVCLILGFSLSILAWLDVREIRRKIAEAQRDIWRDVADDRKRKTPDAAE